MRISDWSSDVCSSDLDHGGSKEMAGASQALAAQYDLAAQFQRVFDELGHGRHSACVRQGAHLSVGVQAIAHLDGFKGIDEDLQELVVGFFVNIETGGRDADLAGEIGRANV